MCCLRYLLSFIKAVFVCLFGATHQPPQNEAQAVVREGGKCVGKQAARFGVKMAAKQVGKQAAQQGAKQFAKVVGKGALAPGGLVADAGQLGLEAAGYKKAGKVVGAGGNVVAAAAAGGLAGGPPGAAIGGAIGGGVWAVGEITGNVVNYFWPREKEQ